MFNIIENIHFENFLMLLDNFKASYVHTNIPFLKFLWSKFNLVAFTSFGHSEWAEQNILFQLFNGGNIMITRSFWSKRRENVKETKKKFVYFQCHFLQGHG